ncbi:hypothetical protein BD770DRAFT_403853 [Pilaira anomala]|nr:hypothetical protein BD770DRAFT_403853 [Pilaira anomala]
MSQGRICLITHRLVGLFTKLPVVVTVSPNIILTILVSKSITVKNSPTSCMTTRTFFALICAFQNLLTRNRYVKPRVKLIIIRSTIQTTEPAGKSSFSRKFYRRHGLSSRDFQRSLIRDQYRSSHIQIVVHSIFMKS